MSPLHVEEAAPGDGGPHPQRRPDFGTHPSFTKDGVLALRSHRVTLHDIYPGYLDPDRRGTHDEVVQGKVRWVGAGRYWSWTDIHNVELLSEVETASS